MNEVALVLVGAASGFLGGMLGIGGGVIIVPALILIFGAGAIHPDADITVIAVATSMACIVFTSLSAAVAQYRAGKVDFELFARLVPFFIAGSFGAGLLAPFVDAAVLRTIIGVFLLMVSVVMLTAWTPPPRRVFPGFIGSGAIGLGGGLVSGTAGIAGGNVIVPTLVYFGTAMHRATATSSAMGVPIALAGALGYALGLDDAPTGRWLIGYVDLKSGLFITAAAVITAPLGVKLAHRVNAATLKRAFGGLLLIVAARMICSAYAL